VVLNYRTPELTLACARALRSSTRPLDDLIVVDNGSGDGSEARLRAALPGAGILQAGANLGFAGGANLGIGAALAAGADLVFLANSDVEVAPGCLGSLEAALRARPDLGIVGPSVLTRDDPGIVETQGASFSPLTGRMRHRGAGRRVDEREREACRVVDAVSGCAMLVRREVFERIGLLADDYFFSFEDLDFCLRARCAGFRSGWVGAAAACHGGSRTIGPASPRRLYFAARNHLLLARRAAPLPAPLAALRGALVVALNLGHALARSPVPAAQGLRAIGRGVWDHLAERYGAGG
jgi:hypothetical protein